jgi:hypothetical protein
MNANAKVSVHDDKTHAITHGEIIHIEDSNDDAQYIGTTTALTSTHHMQQQLRTEDIGDHVTGQQTQQPQEPQSYEHVSRPSPNAHSLHRAMSACPEL